MSLPLLFAQHGADALAVAIVSCSVFALQGCADFEFVSVRTSGLAFSLDGRNHFKSAGIHCALCPMFFVAPYRRGHTDMCFWCQA